MICLAMATNHDFKNKSRIIVVALTNMTPKDRKSKAHSMQNTGDCGTPNIKKQGWILLPTF